jgi:hypothetical protein
MLYRKHSQAEWLGGGSETHLVLVLRDALLFTAGSDSSAKLHHSTDKSNFHSKDISTASVRHMLSRTTNVTH